MPTRNPANLIIMPNNKICFIDFGKPSAAFRRKPERPFASSSTTWSAGKSGAWSTAAYFARPAPADGCGNGVCVEMEKIYAEAVSMPCRAMRRNGGKEHSSEWDLRH